MSDLIAVAHPRFSRVDPTIFTKQLVADCMSHACRDRAAAKGERERLDACCQYGADVDLHERDRIMEHEAELRALLTPAANAAPWFTTEVEVDPEMPSGGN